MKNLQKLVLSSKNQLTYMHDVQTHTTESLQGLLKSLLDSCNEYQLEWIQLYIAARIILLMSRKEPWKTPFDLVLTLFDNNVRVPASCILTFLHGSP